ncbi:hypothetical protein FSP39_006346 [Pinctada imbricata]|uniref:CBM20 domain-containing protein n=1 Tax=Pinctada imbricata TaxID=66713 RepID=A0AA88XMS3_PINIB|nr:hypothetical protein FSP39_006346 [Pinctada imbricata]
MSTSVDNPPSNDEDEFVWLQFETKYLVPDVLCCLAVCGSIRELGYWDVRHAVIADEKPKDSGNWIVSVFLPTSVNIEWKWVVLHRETRHVIRWEERYNRWYHTGYRSGRILASWNRDHAFRPAPSGNGMEWDKDDSNQLEELIHCLENQTNKAEESSPPLTAKSTWSP